MFINKHQPEKVVKQSNLRSQNQIANIIGCIYSCGPTAGSKLLLKIQKSAICIVSQNNELPK